VHAAVSERSLARYAPRVPAPPDDAALEALFAEGLARDPIERLANEVARATFEPIGRGDFAGALRVAIALADEFADAHREARRARALPIVRVACARGCAACCALRVEITDAEASLIAASLDPVRAERVVARAAEVGALPLADRLRARIPCALLGDEGECTAHAIRPFVCRAATSASAEACACRLSEVDEAGAIEIEIDGFAATRAAYLGFRRALRAWGAPAERRELHVAVAEACATLDPPALFTASTRTRSSR
jgi:Fe-S-cluster containining protein